MTDSTERAVARVLDPYAHALRHLEPSAALDARMETAIGAWAEQSAARRLWRRPLPWVVAAASVAVVAGGIALLMSRDGQRSSDGGGAPQMVVVPADSARPSDTNTSRAGDLSYARLSPLAAGQVSLYPAESAIFRVKASFASAASLPHSGDPQQGERQYWVDVRIANDGTMRIVQVIPAERGRVVPRE
jgi:hypothetical protein